MSYWQSPALVVWNTAFLSVERLVLMDWAQRRTFMVQGLARVRWREMVNAVSAAQSGGWLSACLRNHDDGDHGQAISRTLLLGINQGYATAPELLQQWCSVVMELEPDDAVARLALWLSLAQATPTSGVPATYPQRAGTVAVVVAG